MKSKMQSILNKTKFFKILNSTNNGITYTLEKPSRILIENIYINWLRYLHLKTQKHMPIYIQKTTHVEKTKELGLPFGLISHTKLELKDKTFQYVFDAPFKNTDSLLLKIIIPQQDYMQNFIQWQRYRKYWWSSVTTTPSLFAIGDIKQRDSEAEVDIVAKLPCGLHTVEQINIKNNYNDFKNSACLTCSMSLERALFILLLDGINNDSNEQYLRLHRKIAPYKMSFALNSEDPKNKQSLKDLAALLFYRLNMQKVSAFLPDSSIPSDEQLNTNLQMGIPYTAILNEQTLQNGILHLMNSSTMLKEQIHVADFHSYAALVCNSK